MRERYYNIVAAKNRLEEQDFLFDDGLENYGLQPIIYKRLNDLGWLRFRRQPAKANLNWVREFYAHNAEGKDTAVNFFSIAQPKTTGLATSIIDPTVAVGHTEPLELSSDACEDIFDWHTLFEHQVQPIPTPRATDIQECSHAQKRKAPTPVEREALSVEHPPAEIPATDTDPARRRGKAPVGRIITRDHTSSTDDEEHSSPRPSKRQRRYHVITTDNLDVISVAIKDSSTSCNQEIKVIDNRRTRRTKDPKLRHGDVRQREWRDARVGRLPLLLVGQVSYMWSLLVLKHERKEYVIEEPIPNDPGVNAPRADKDKFKKHMDDMVYVRCLMLATMTLELQKQHEDMVSYEMIQNLKDIYEEQARQERYETSKALFQCKMSERSPVGAHVIKMMGYIQALEKLGFPLNDELANDVVLQSLPDSFNKFVLNFNMNEINKTLPQLLSKLRTAKSNMKKGGSKSFLMVHEAKRKGNKVAKSKVIGKTKPKGMNALKTKGGISKEVKCFHCDKPGHWKRNCLVYLEGGQ
ncbi:hypothetical protein GQ457_04G021260 [Hibiscus cannabinus]